MDDDLLTDLQITDQFGRCCHWHNCRLNFFYRRSVCQLSLRQSLFFMVIS